MFQTLVKELVNLGIAQDEDEARANVMQMTPVQMAAGLTAAWRGQFQDYVWPHLIYAYAIENTRIYEIFRRVIAEYLHGEKLGSPSFEAQQWIHTTADMFYKDTPSLSDWSLDNHVRPKIAAIRRNAYYRMFGMDLNHSPLDGEHYVKPEEHNDSFVQALEKLLQEVWTGYKHRVNATGSNPTDDAAISYLATKLREMLEARRQGANLAREEFFSVATMSWLYLTVDHNSPIVIAANASSSSAHERLRLLGEKVGVPAHSKSEHFFEMAYPASKLLLTTEAGDYDDSADAALLYDESNPITFEVQDLITHWSMATGRDMKATTVSAPA